MAALTLVVGSICPDPRNVGEGANMGRRARAMRLSSGLIPTAFAAPLRGANNCTAGSVFT
jgi:hypothetical protein